MKDNKNQQATTYDSTVQCKELALAHRSGHSRTTKHSIRGLALALDRGYM